jgi:phospholipase A1
MNRGYYEVFFYLILYSNLTFAVDEIANRQIESSVGKNQTDAFSFFQPSYFIFGKHDLKLQFSFKYLFFKETPIYLGYTQTMFWNIYQKSMPFYDINYHPEFYYSFLNENNFSFKTIDFGYLHSSNGNKGKDSRSFDRVFLRAKYLSKINRHSLDFNLTLYKSYNWDSFNKDIDHYIGFWDFKVTVSDVFTFKNQRLDFEGRIFAGKEIVNINHGAYQIGFIYSPSSINFNPAIYFQRYQGYFENLLEYNIEHTVYRLGILLQY